MRSDALLAFIPIGSPLSLTTGTLTSNVIDLMGSGVGTAPPNIIGTRTVFGQDPGIGQVRPELNIVTGSVTPAGGTSLNVQLQYAVDAGTPTYLPGTWITIAETGAIVTASLAALQHLARFPFLPAFPVGTLPRYLRLAFVIVGTYTAGTIDSALVVPSRDDQANKFSAKNFVVA